MIRSLSRCYGRFDSLPQSLSAAKEAGSSHCISRRNSNARQPLKTFRYYPAVSCFPYGVQPLQKASLRLVICALISCKEAYIDKSKAVAVLFPQFFLQRESALQSMVRLGVATFIPVQNTQVIQHPAHMLFVPSRFGDGQALVVQSACLRE